MKPHLFPLLLFFYCLSAQSQQPSLFFEKIDAQNGLSNNKVNCILQDKRGFIWLGTNDGLNRYDGKNFLIFRHKPNDSTTISGNIITDILEDKEDRLWIATADGGLSRYNYRLPPAQQFKQYEHLPGNAASIPVNIINTLLEDPFGYLWLGTSGKSVLRFNKSNERFEEIVPKGTRTVLDFGLDKNGIIWAGRVGGSLLKINPATLGYNEDERYRNLYAKLPHASVTALYADKENSIWFGSWDKVLYNYNLATAKEKGYSSNGEYSFQGDEILCFAEDNSGWLWMGGSEKGLQLYDKHSGKFYNYRYDPSKEGAIADNRINSIFKDASGRIWLGTNKGVCINNPAKQQFVQTFLSTGKTSPLTVYDFYEDENESLWIGTSDGLFIKKKDGSITQRKLFYKEIPLHITCFFKDDDGSFYLGTNYSLFTYNPASNAIALLPNTEKDGVMNRIIDSRIVSIMKHQINGEPVLVTAPYGHYLTWYNFKKQNWVSRLDTTINIIEQLNLKDNLIRKFYKTRDGIVWIPTAKEGLGVWMKNTPLNTFYYNNSPSNPRSITNNNVYDVKEAVNGNLWVSTSGGGLHFFNTKTKEFIQVAASNNLGEGLETDHNGHVWMVSNGNLHKYDAERRMYTSYELPDLEKTGGVKGKIFKYRKGRLNVAGNNYFISFHPDSIGEVRTSPKAYLTNFSIFNNSVSHLLFEDEIKLNYKDNYFSIEFAAPDYSSSIYYSYMLEGFDRDWIDAAERTYASYPNLEGGNYIFKVRASNSPGVWPKEYTSVNIEIIPPFWKRWWFFALLALATAGVIYLIYRYRIKELLKRQAIRNKIAQDLHDNVGSTLSSISVYSQVAKIYHQQQKQDDLKNALEKISSTSSEMISELNDTVWAINPRNDNMDVILQRMESLAKPLLASQSIQFHFEHDKQVSSVNLDMEKRKNFYLVFKETVNNVLKYAECKNLAISIRQKGSSIVMKIKDDGRGFDLSKTSEGYKSSDVFGGGNGLKNMQWRAREMKGNLRIETAPGKGCYVELSFPIT